MSATVIVYGPTGCGKTRNAARIAAKLGIPTSKIIDDWGDLDDRVRRGYLHLTNVRPTHTGGAKVIHYKSLGLQP